MCVGGGGSGGEGGNVEKKVGIIVINHLTTCRSSQPGERPTNLIAGLVSNVSVGLNISNQRDDAFQAILSFSLPSALLEFVRVEPRSVCHNQFTNSYMTERNAQLLCHILFPPPPPPPPHTHTHTHTHAHTTHSGLHYVLI